ncbi:MAG: glycosyltransferase family 9 protein [Alphaproteobacteria bacterium]|nr:MAG: glycosyltransferase family 9 protein [Alphaproteobacteria bacterium]
MTDYKNILFIRLSAFGDFILTLGVMEAVRKYHPDAKITLLTTPLFEELAKQSGYFDQVLTMRRYGFAEIGKWLELRRTMNTQDFDLVYDMQQNDRTKILRLLSPSKARKNWYRGGATTKQVLPITDSRDFPIPDMPWMDGDTSGFALKPPFVLLVPGAAPQHPLKRWPADHYGVLAQKLAKEGFQPVILGGPAEQEIAAAVAEDESTALNLCGETSFGDIAALARKAVGAVGNDTGPMHLISAAGCPVVSLFGGTSHPDQSAPNGKNVTVLRAIPIEKLPPEDVWQGFAEILRKSAAAGAETRSA